MTTQNEQAPTVFIVDDDAAIRFAMQALMDSVNLNHEIFGSGDEFLEKMTDQRPGCLVLDIRMPGLGGLELQEELIKRGNTSAHHFHHRPWRRSDGCRSHAKRRR